MHLVTLATADVRVAQRSTTTSGQKSILSALDLPEPPKYLDLTTTTSDCDNPPAPPPCSNTTQIRRITVCAGQPTNPRNRVPTISGSPVRSLTCFANFRANNER
jgi:hypothetical protein